MALIDSRALIHSLACIALGGGIFTACSSGPGLGSSEDDGGSNPNNSSGGAEQGSGGKSGEDNIDPDDIPATAGSGPTTTTVEIIKTLPEHFLPADAEHPETSKGGFQVVGPLGDVAPPEGECANVLRVIVRDFQGSHDDFENAGDWNKYEVQSPIGATRKPIKTSENGPQHLEEWYQNLDSIDRLAAQCPQEALSNTFIVLPVDDTSTPRNLHKAPQIGCVALMEPNTQPVVVVSHAPWSSCATMTKRANQFRSIAAVWH